MKTASECKWARAYKALFALVTIALCALLCAQTISIYVEGISPENIDEYDAYKQPIYSREVVGERLRAVRWLACVWLVMALAGLVLGRAYFDERELYTRRALNLKRAYADVARAAPRLSVYWVALLVAALELIVLGVINQGMRDMLYKAIQICSECIGLG